MDAATLAQAMGNRMSIAEYERLTPGYNNAMRVAGITTVLRSAMFAAQLGHESVGLHAMEEYADGSAYNGRKDLGNIYPGDGPRYKGRGPIQLTGRNNYRAFSAWAKKNGHSGIDFEAQPHLLSEPHWGFLAAAYYWSTRPSLNQYADQGDVLRASAVINGWYTNADGSLRTPNGYQDRLARYRRALPLGERLLPTKEEGMTTHQTLIEYKRDNVVQLTPYNCGPASVETIVQGATNRWVPETKLAGELGTHRGGTDWIGQFPKVLNQNIPGAKYRHVEMPNDPPSQAQKDRFWEDLTGSIQAGHGVVCNIVAPQSNYPRAVAPSTISPAYRGGTVYHYIAAMGYAGTGGSRRVWIADSGFAPYGYWISFEQLASLIPPKGYAYSTAAPQDTPTEGDTVLLTGESAAALNDAKIAAQQANAKVDRLEKKIDLMLDQFAGPGRGDDGMPTWQGWGGGSAWPGTEGVASIQNIITRLDRIEGLVHVDPESNTKKGK